MQRLTNLRWLVLLFATGCLLAQPALAHCCPAMASGLTDETAAKADCPTHGPAASGQAAPAADMVPAMSTLHCDWADAPGCGAVLFAAPGHSPQRLETEALAWEPAMDLAPDAAAAAFPGSGISPPPMRAFLPAVPNAVRQHLLLTQRWRL